MEYQHNKPRIWAVGGGKGGVGKSTITTNLAVALAKRGFRCVLVDADFGGANLHTMIGIPAPDKNLTQLFIKEVGNLSDVQVPTPFKNLSLISGAFALMDMANPKRYLKKKLINEMLTLDADIVLLDLSAGSSLNVIDFFLAAHEPITVIVPTPTSVENAYHFLKAAFIRRLNRSLAEAKIGHLVDKAKVHKVALGIRTPRELIEHLVEVDPQAGSLVAKKMASLRPKLIINQARRAEDFDLGPQIALACKDYFGVDMNFVGSVNNDERVLASIQMKKPVLAAYPNSPFGVSIESILSRLVPVKKGEERVRPL